ncbi:MAG TPA: hypothetical protein VFI18_00435 [Gaiellales bacterium]|nr:hypothetical protein [Gaiellales bacterium]
MAETQAPELQRRLVFACGAWVPIALAWAIVAASASTGGDSLIGFDPGLLVAGVLTGLVGLGTALAGIIAAATADALGTRGFPHRRLAVFALLANSAALLSIVAPFLVPHSGNFGDLSSARRPDAVVPASAAGSIDGAHVTLIPLAPPRRPTWPDGTRLTTNGYNRISARGPSGDVRWSRRVRRELSVHGCVHRATLIEPNGTALVGCDAVTVAIDEAGHDLWQFRRHRYTVSGFVASPRGGTFVYEFSNGSRADAVISLTENGHVRWANTVDRLIDVANQGMDDEEVEIEAAAADDAGGLVIGTNGYLASLGPDGRRRWRVDSGGLFTEIGAIVIGPGGNVFAFGKTSAEFVQQISASGHLGWIGRLSGASAIGFGPNGTVEVVASQHAYRFENAVSP